MKISYNWLQKYFDENLPEPEKVSEGIIFHSFEVEDIEKLPPLSLSGSSPQAGEQDTIFDIKVLPDRNHDCLSHFGVAKEVGIIFSLKLKENKYKKFDEKSTDLEIKIKDDKCLRYVGRIVRDVKVGESPIWLKEKLHAIGQKSINNIVDAANYVMFDIGQPIHCFDLDKLESPKIIIRNAVAGEVLTTLDKKEVKLDESILVIADENYVLAIAGIKGGTKAEVDNTTSSIVIEVANFNAVTTRKTAKKINILTDAVKRYENEITPEMCADAMSAITDLIYTLAGGEVEDIVDIYPSKPTQTVIRISLEYINKRLGSDFREDEIVNVWEKLGFKYDTKDGNFIVTIPYLRIDLIGPHDLTEEVIRILGYDRLVPKLPEIKLEPKVNEFYYKILFARNKLLTDGYGEVMTYVFRDKGELEVLASASGKNFLRDNILDGLKESIKLNILNAPLLGIDNIKVFEIGTVFKKSGEVMNVAYGDKKNVTEMTLEEFFEKNSRGEEISFEKFSENFLRHSFSQVLGSPRKEKGELGQTISEKNSVSKFSSPLPLEANSKQQTAVFTPWSVYPFISRDIAVWVPNEVESNQVYKVIKENAGEFLIREPQKFDEFTKGDKTSFAFRLVFQSYEKTLKDEEINPIMQKITDKINFLGWEVR